MIEKRIPLEIPPGLVMNGTTRERAGRWMDGDLVRFPANTGHPEAIGGWATLSGDSSIPSGEPRGMHHFYDSNGGLDRVFVSTVGNLYYFVPNSAAAQIHNVTPTGLVYPSMGGAAASFDNMGSDLFFMSSGSSKLIRWNASQPGGFTAPATEVTQFTSAHGTGVGVVVTPENFLVVLKPEVTGPEVKWATQNGYTDWTPTTTNSAGAIKIPSTGRLMRGLVVGSETLIFTTTDLWAMQYVGGELVYGIRLVGDACGLFGVNMAVAVENRAFWMGENGFFQYDGYVRQLACPISEEIFSDINRSQRHKCFVSALPAANEVWWFYSTEAFTAPNRLVIYNYANDTWSFGTLQRSAGTHGTIEGLNTGSKPAKKSFPIMADVSGVLYAHELATHPTEEVFIESGPVTLGDGERTMRVQKVIPDGALNSDEIELLYSRDDDLDTLFTNGSTSVTEGVPIDVRFTARSVRYKQTLNSFGTKVGVPQLGVIPSSPR